jgi:hypothetical protein
MGKLTDYLTSLLSRHLDEHGFVVWFDPETHYEAFVKELSLEKAECFLFDGSLFALKHEVEQALSQKERPRALVYIPKARHETHNALIEVEKAGCVLTPGHASIHHNTRLEVIARAVLKPLMPDSVENICRQIASGGLSFTEVERIAEQSQAIGSGVIKLIFDTTDPVEIALRFLNEPDLDENITAKNAMPELRLILNTSFGIDTPDTPAPEALRKTLKQFVLLSDFVNDLSPEEIPQPLSGMSFPEKETQKGQIAKLASEWRNSHRYKAAYIEDANQIMETCKLEDYHISPSRLACNQTFASTEAALIDWACERILDGDFDEIHTLVAERKHSFWSLASLDEAKFGLQWDLLSTVIKICETGETIESALKAKAWTPTELIHQYTTTDKPWFGLDTFHRELEQQFERFDMNLSDEGGLMEKVIAQARHVYTGVIREMAETFQEACESSSFDFGDVLQQREIYPSEVAPRLEQGQKIAYIWVDALRYEMASQLIEGLKGKYDVQSTPCVGTLPGITAVGMASLLPHADTSLTIGATSQGKLALSIEGTKINTRADRVKYLKDATGSPGFMETKLEALLRPRKQVREAVTASSFILVTSQEIDEICEQGNVSVARKIMGDILDGIRRAIVNLTHLGVEVVVLAADHGYLFLEAIDSGDKIDAPGGVTVELHARAWLGHGGSKSHSTLRVDEKVLGFTGEHELAFPRGIGCFKVKGKDNPYFHGGLSLQETIIPLVTIQSQTATEVGVLKSEFGLSMDKSAISTRFFSVQALWQLPQQSQLFSATPKEKRVHLAVKAGGQEVGMAVQAVYGYDSGTQDIILQQGKPNHITLMLTEELTQKSVSVHILDADSLVELARLDKIRVEIAL